MNAYVLYIMYTKADDGQQGGPKRVAVLNKITVLCLMVDIVICPFSACIRGTKFTKFERIRFHNSENQN
jgi:hypothetical protein